MKYVSEGYPNTSSFRYLLLKNFLIGPVDGVNALVAGAFHYGLTFLAIAVTTLMLYGIWTGGEKMFSRMRARRE